MRVTNGYGTNTEYLTHSPKKPTETNETMKFRRSREDSYSIGATTDAQKLEFTSYYSADAKIKDSQLEKTNSTVSALTILQVCHWRCFVFFFSVTSLTIDPYDLRQRLLNIFMMSSPTTSLSS
jgi:hypothetical protein